MYTTDGRQMSWDEFNKRRDNGEEIFVGNYPKEDKEAFKQFAHTHTAGETLTWLDEHEFNEDIMYTDGKPDCYDKWNGECAGIRCQDGSWIWNLPVILDACQLQCELNDSLERQAF